MPRVTGGPSSEDGVQAVVLALRILEFLAQQRAPTGVTELAQALGTTKTRVFRYLRTLLQLGYVVQSEASERYQIGAALVHLGRMVGDHLDLGAIAYPILRELRDELGHPAVLTQVEADGVRVLTFVPSKIGLGVDVKVGTLLHFHSSAQGKIALAFGEEDLRRRILSSRLEMQTPNTITQAAALDEEIERVRQRGWAVAPNEALVGLNVLAAPVFDAMGALVGAVGIADSVQFIGAVPSEQQIRLTTMAARRVSEALGFRSASKHPPKSGN